MASALAFTRREAAKRTLGDKLHELAWKAPEKVAAIEVLVDYLLAELAVKAQLDAHSRP